ncbi:MAG: chromosome segregation protein SMC [Clostridia bacterium]
MYLKAVEIQGFKSFPDKVLVEFGQGITAIVGPNGSGKSNISDAVRWVLGEQSAKILRGSKMEDVIFAGTELRKPVGFAEVSLTLDNSNKIVPIDYTEVTITRRVYRSGESEYFINKSSCRLKDIHQLFMDTGLGKDGYSIIGQGKIDEILSSKSEERRLIFEEAAGITKYKYRKEEAEKKLELTKQNLIRLKDIISELELQIEPLGEQSEKARQYLNMKEELKILEINVYLDTIESMRKNSNDINEKYNLTASQLQQEQQKLQESEEILDSLYEFMKTHDVRIEETRDKLHTTQSAIEKHKNDIVILQNNIKNNKEVLQKINEEFNIIEKKIVSLNEEILQKKNLLENHIQKLKDIQLIIDSLELKSKQEVDALETEDIAIDTLKSDVIDKMNQVSETRSKINSLKVLENNFVDRKKSIDTELEEYHKGLQQHEEAICSMKNEHKKLSSDIQNKKNQLQTYHDELISKRANHKMLSSEYSSLITLSKEIISKKTLLEEMERDYEGYSKSVKNILKAWKNGRLTHLKIHGTVSKLITVPEQFITAIEIALGSAMQHIIVEKENDAKEAIQFLKTNQSGRATFLPISSVKGNILEDSHGKISSCKGYQGIASHLIDFKNEYQGIFNNLLGRVVIVDTIENAIAMARAFSYKFRIVTLEGEVLSPGGSLSGGSINKVSSFLSRAKEIEKMNQQLTQIHDSKEEYYKKINYEEQEINNIEKQNGFIEKGLKEEENYFISLEAEIKHKNLTYEQMLQNRDGLLRETKQVREQIKITEGEMLQFTDFIKRQESEIETIKSQISLRQSDYKTRITSKEDTNRQLMDHKIVLGAIHKDIDVTNERIELIQNEMTQLENNKTDKNQELLVLARKNESLQVNINDKASVIHTLEDEMALLQQNTNDYLKEKEEAQQNINSHQVLMKEKREYISLLQSEYHRLENRKIKIELELDNSINKLWDEYELTFTNAEQYKKDIGSIANAQKEINKLKNEIRQLGNINVNAIEEYKNVKERFEFLSNQHDDLEQAEQGLLKIISDILHLMKKQFIEQFSIINEYFNEVFNQLFGGGRAELRLSEPDKILESGIEIEVQPPGKKLQNIMLLSGGEKAFTAIALLFAILKVKPTPFCILDEIEAALDDANVYRFAQYLKKFSTETQFIVVTHRRGTMESSDVLYGVTMQEKGVSKMISLKMDEVAS